MNTRGIVQLVVLNIGVQLKVISPVIFAMFVLMATVLTFLTSPILSILYRNVRDEELNEEDQISSSNGKEHFNDDDRMKHSIQMINDGFLQEKNHSLASNTQSIGQLSNNPAHVPTPRKHRRMTLF